MMNIIYNHDNGINVSTFRTDCNNTQYLENEERHSDYSYASENASDLFQNRTYRTQRLDSLESVDFDTISDFDNNSLVFLDIR